MCHDGECCVHEECAEIIPLIVEDVPAAAAAARASSRRAVRVVIMAPRSPLVSCPLFRPFIYLCRRCDGHPLEATRPYQAALYRLADMLNDKLFSSFGYYAMVEC